MATAGAVVTAAVAVPLCILQWILQNRLTALLDHHVLPRIRREAGVDVTVEHARVNLPAGFLSLRDVAVASPPGFAAPAFFTADRLRLDVGMAALLAREYVDVRNAYVSGGVLTLVRNKDGQWNIDRLGRPAGTPPPAHPPGDTAKPRAPAAASRNEDCLPARARTVRLETIVRYLDHQLAPAGQPLDITLRLVLTGTNITSRSAAPEKWGAVSVRGAQASNAKAWVTRLDGRLAPIGDPDRLSFDLAGTIASVDVEPLRPRMAEIGCLCDALSLDIDLHCRQGRFDSRKSFLSFSMEGVTLTTNLVADLPDALRRMDSVVLPVPLGGTIEEPEIDVAQALVHAALENLKRNPDILLKSNLLDILKEQRKTPAGTGDDRKKNGATDLIEGLKLPFRL